MQIHKPWRKFSTLMLVLSLILGGCSLNTADSDNEHMTEDSFYGSIASATLLCLLDIYNQNLAGKIVGTQNMTVIGPFGGTVVITGTTGYSDNTGLTTTDLDFAMDTVSYTYVKNEDTDDVWTTKVLLTGTMTYNGSFSDDFTSLNHQGTDVIIQASVTHGDEVRTLDTTGTLIINRSASTVTASVMGYSVSW